MAGVPGFEPGSDGIKTRCLTAWLYPNREDKKNVLDKVYFYNLRYLKQL